MAQKRAKTAATKTIGKASALAATLKTSQVNPAADAADGNQANHNTWSDLFSQLACETAHLAGKPLTFLIAVLLVVLWASTGPVFNYSDTWQLVINTSTTIITFLMVFLIQHTQNRDTLAIQLKLSELIIAMQEAENKIAAAEDLSEEELQELHEEYRRRAEHTLEHLHQRRGKDVKKAS
jgi:low affinity Fe/Cu permease